MLSVDVAMGAVCSAIFFSHVFFVELRVAGLMALGITVWIIYTVDHLLDAGKLKRTAVTERHKFHQDYKGLLWIGVALAISSIMVLIFFMRRPVLIWGLTGGVLMVVYLLVQQYLHFLKEVLIAVLYTCGLMLPSMALTPLALNDWPWLFMTLFCLTALINLLLFSWFDIENDRVQGASSLATALGYKTIRVVITLLFISIAVGIFYLPELNQQLLLLLMNGVLLILFVFHNQVRTKEMFRIWGDFVFMFPVLFR